MIEEDLDTAFLLYNKAASVGHMGAIYMVADMLIDRQERLGEAVHLLYEAGMVLNGNQ